MWVGVEVGGKRRCLHERLGELEAAGRLYIAEAVRWVLEVWVDVGDKCAAASTDDLANWRRRGGCTSQKPSGEFMCGWVGGEGQTLPGGSVSGQMGARSRA